MNKYLTILPEQRKLSWILCYFLLNSIDSVKLPDCLSAYEKLTIKFSGHKEGTQGQVTPLISV